MFRTALFLAALFSSSAAHAAMLSGQFKGRYGALEIYDAQTKLSFRVNTPRLAERLTPCETYLWPHTAIALGTGAIKDNTTKIVFDPNKHPAASTWPEVWRRDHTFESALRDSVPWYAGELSTRIGNVKLAQHLKRIKYGNADISGGLDKFWNTSSLRITGLEQVDFVRGFREGRLGFSPNATKLVKEAMVQERTPDYTIYGMPGTCAHDATGTKYLGWLIGFVERPGKVWYYAMNIDAKAVADFGTARLDIVRGAMAEMGFIPLPPAATAPTVATSASPPATSEPVQPKPGKPAKPVKPAKPTAPQR